MKYIIFDLETYPNIFTFCGFDYQTKQTYLFELSDRKNQKKELMQFLNYAKSQDYYFVGFNNIGFDYPILHSLFLQPHTFSYATAANLCNQIIEGQKFKSNQHVVWMNDRYIKQIDLMKIHHMDNKARRTSLKALQFAMRSESVEDLPFDIRQLNDAEKDALIQYNIHDVMETVKFFEKSLHLIQMRKELVDQKVIYGDVLNFSDVKIGYEYLVKEIGRDVCFSYVNGKKKENQTLVYDVKLKDVILPKIYFRDSEYTKVLEHFQTLTWKKFKDEKDEENQLSFQRTINGFKYKFGIGGIHGSVESKYYEANDEYEIIDLDVTSLYPSIGIVNRFYPLHLGESFCDKYAALKAKRQEHKKGTPMNAMFKLALNGAYGKSNDIFSAMYDPSYMLKITINGQLQLLQLAEYMNQVPGLEIIQINTDGITCKVPKQHKEWLQMYRKVWESETGLELEEAHYKRLWIRDVNNYLGIHTSGKIKSKGAYWYPEKIEDYDGSWHKDFSAMVVQKGIKESLVDGVHPEYIVRLFTNPYDFMMRYKTTKGSKVYIGDKECSKTVRYYVSTKGHKMLKRSDAKGPVGSFKRKNKLSDAQYMKIASTLQPGQWDERIHTKNKSTYEVVETGIEAARLVKQCNKASDFDWSDVDYDYYAKEIEKLCF